MGSGGWIGSGPLSPKPIVDSDSDGGPEPFPEHFIDDDGIAAIVTDPTTAAR
jgi:hypothetical protein